MAKSRIRVTNWPHQAAPTELELQSLLENEGLTPTCWSKTAGHVSELQLHPFKTVVYVLEGRITYRLPGSRRSINLDKGDRIDLPAWVVHAAVAGPDGVVCVEGRRGTSFKELES